MDNLLLGVIFEEMEVGCACGREELKWNDGPGSCIKRLQLRSVGFDTRYRVLAKRRYGLLKNREVLMKSRGTPRMKHVLTDYRTDILYVDNFESD
ncbi:hypothetical protein NDU88_003726 [Pleurodeles waltl]|uniref:Uncharacterized protein n=1 Tax=Pleurodeles waltl TaxID=8319 RepID=A0AAV7T600_PLEWA|nr:hypothetical protein NDU88_003726 [Pleurodeles waltl]